MVRYIYRLILYHYDLREFQQHQGLLKVALAKQYYVLQEQANFYCFL